MRGWKFRLPTVLFLGTFVIGSAAVAADWPTYRHDLMRSGVSPDNIGPKLYMHWKYVPSQKPRPAWPEPGRELNRLAFDYVYNVVVGNGMAYFGSSSDDKVYALDLKSGRERWSFFTEGPIRFAPTLYEDRVYVVSDDGYLYCLAANDGQLIWKFQAEPRHEKVIGNGRMISRWPLRSGVGVKDGVVYLAAGMWPSEGIFVYALRADDGKVLWKNDTSGSVYIPQPHPPSAAETGVSPQGYLLANETQLFLPTGRNVPAAYDLQTGKLLYYVSRPRSWGDRWGGTWNFLVNGLIFVWRCHIGPDIDVHEGEYQPDPNDGMIAFSTRNFAIHRDFPGKLHAVVHGGVLYASGRGKISAYDFDAWKKGKPLKKCTKWETPHGRAYALILAGKTLVVGGRGTITTMDAKTGKVLQQIKVKGEVRGLAAADGRLIASTTDGAIFCFGSTQAPNPQIVQPSRPNLTLTRDAEDRALNILRTAGKMEGLCFVAGADADLLKGLALKSALTIYAVDPDAKKTAAARKALDEAHLYGIRITVHHGDLASIRYPDYFADLIVADERVIHDEKDWPVRELYRMLHPDGGTAVILCADAKAAASVAHRLGNNYVPKKEVTWRGNNVVIVRGKLSGIDDWTHQYANAQKTGASNDRRARLPLKLLWFGKPGPMPLISRHWRGPSPLCVDGRMFVIGQKSIIAVDAYNGRELWRQNLPRAGRWPVDAKGSNAAADQGSLYLATGKKCLRFDAATGRIIKTYTIPGPPSTIPKDKQKSLIWSYLAVGDDVVLGSIGNDREGQCVFALNKDGSLRWKYVANGTVGNNMISMDANRVYIIDRTSPQDVERAKRRGVKIKVAANLIALDVKTGKPVWKTEKGIQKRSALWLSKGILLATGGGGMSGYEAKTGKLLYSKEVSMWRPPVLVGRTIYAEPKAYDLQTGEPLQRQNPFGSGEESWAFRRSYGCGSISGSPNLLMFRSSTIGFYDLAGDSGVHNFGAVRAGCYVNTIAADGLVLAPPADAACTCSYPFQTTVALEPAMKYENWAVFCERIPNAPVRQLALNLGAPGDQRDSKRTLWLAMPRPDTRWKRKDIAIPFRFLFDDRVHGTYRRNADLISIAATNKPWVYASGLKGVRRVALDLLVLDRCYSSWPDAAPTIDGREGDRCWDGFRSFAVAGRPAKITFRHDAKNLYVLYKQDARKGPNGKVVAWNAKTKGKDAPVWKDDSMELFFSPMPADTKLPSRKYVHLGVSASGATYDGMWTFVPAPLPVCDVPELKGIKIDGDVSDWNGRGLLVKSLVAKGGKMKAPKDFDQVLHLAWTKEGIAILAQVSDNKIVESPKINELWRGDSMEIFMTPKLGSDESFQVVYAPGADGKHKKARWYFYDHRKKTAGTKLATQAVGRKTKNGYVLEVLLPWKNLKIKPEQGEEIGLQIFINDDDGRGDKYRFRVMWHPDGHPSNTGNPCAYQLFKLAQKASAPIAFKRSAKPGNDHLFTAVPPYPYPIVLPAMGAKKENARFDVPWTARVSTDNEKFIAEAAIPWESLRAAGLNEQSVMLNISARGPLTEPPLLGRGFERFCAVSPDQVPPRRLTLRLHFAELLGAKAGQRVFDVKVQGETVLKNFDIAEEAGQNTALVKTFKNIDASRSISIEFVPKARTINEKTAPILSGIEIK